MKAVVSAQINVGEVSFWDLYQQIAEEPVFPICIIIAIADNFVQFCYIKPSYANISSKASVIENDGARGGSWWG